LFSKNFSKTIPQIAFIHFPFFLQGFIDCTTAFKKAIKQEPVENYLCYITVVENTILLSCADLSPE